MHDKIEAGANDDLVNYRTLAPHAVDNHPTDEHLMPLFIAIGAGEDQRPAHPFLNAQRRDLDGHLHVRVTSRFALILEPNE